MNFWIETQRDELYDLLREVDGLVLNDGEARMLTDEINLVRAGWKVLDLGPEVRHHQEGRARRDVPQPGPRRS